MTSAASNAPMGASTGAVQPIQWTGESLRLLDQRQLPEAEHYIECRSAAEVADAISEMVVRGAPAIGIAGAYGLVLAAMAGEPLPAAERKLIDSRPTAVNLRWALKRLQALADRSAAGLLAEAQRIAQQDLEQNLRMAEAGAALLPAGARVLTHCNTGALATGGHGTALGVIRTAHAQGKLRAVYAGETRPWLQGARLTAWELGKEGIACRLIADSAAAFLMAKGEIDWVIVGADRIAANGDVANKIGTYSLAVAARHHGVKFMVVAPSGTFDPECPDGASIPIEERGAVELTEIRRQRLAPPGADAWNPVFDVTPAELVTAVVSENGVTRFPLRRDALDR